MRRALWLRQEHSEYSWSTSLSHTPSILSRMRRIFLRSAHATDPSIANFFSNFLKIFARNVKPNF